MNMRTLRQAAARLGGLLPASAGREPVSFKVNNFDLLRIFAATQVLIFHSYSQSGAAVPAWLAPLIHFSGVPIFFVISGYLISASYERNSDPGKYFRNRFLRIYPGMWACILLTFLLTLLLGYRMAQALDYAWLPAQLAGVIFTPPFLKSFGMGSYNGSLWTIPVELQFYLVLPLAYRFCGLRKGGAGRALLVLGFFALLRLGTNHLLPNMGLAAENGVEKLFRYTFLPHFYLFMLGVALQRMQIYKLRFIAGKGVFWVALYLCAKLLLPVGPAVSVATSLLLGIAVVSTAYTLPKLSGILLRGQDISYGVYIYHFLFINLLAEYGLRQHPSFVPIILAATCAAAALSWVLVEKPFLKKKRSAFHALQ
ncbi:MAG TPA: acyltransferase [Humidesulfovibrio sp.]|uniref:acyltransferase family protein n=1 Tax=Humidesulfovibrio sp. TaxID=2910988 RepID=UPI002BBE96E8|nr:acyltransferase [Humidesulfovibrio sp.]HWR04511.1 acyltransferase [Humidesulfovibrio sp.]